MLCAISGHAPEVPVASTKSGHVFEKSLIEKFVESTGKCPITGEPLSVSDLIPLKISVIVPPRPPSATSIPGMLALMSAEWDALMLESFELKRQLDTARQELAHSLYQHDASCRVIARVSAERDEARKALESAAAAAVLAARPAAGAGASPARAQPGPGGGNDGAAVDGAAAGGSSRGAARERANGQAAEQPPAKRQATAKPSAAAQPQPPEPALPPAVLELFEATFKRLAPGRKKRTMPPSYAPASALGAYALAGRSKLSALAAKAHVTAGELFQPSGAAGADSGWAALMAVGSSDGRLHVANARTGAVVRHFVAPAAGQASAVSSLSCGGSVVVSGCESGVVKLWQLGVGESAEAVACAHTFGELRGGRVVAVCLHATHDFAFAALSAGGFSLLDLKACALVSSASCSPPSPLSCAALHPDGLIFGTGSAGSVQLWDVKTASVAALFEHGAQANLRALAFSENGFHLASAAEDGTVKLWDLRKLSPLAVLGEGSTPAGKVSCARFDTSGQFLAVGGSDGAAVYLAKGWTQLLSAQVPGVLSLAFAADARALVGVTAGEIFGVAAGSE